MIILGLCWVFLTFVCNAGGEPERSRRGAGGVGLRKIDLQYWEKICIFAVDINKQNNTNMKHKKLTLCLLAALTGFAAEAQNITYDTDPTVTGTAIH